jgi:pimeloyl-ACP methyl ester carboxylesterase
MKLLANGLQIEVDITEPNDRLGAPANGQTVMLIMGLGMQLIAWPPTIVEPLAAAGYRVLRFDNRDIGLSQHFDHLGRPNLVWASIKHKLGLSVKPPYTLSDMASDALGVLDALKLREVHVVGVSMGGMIAQRLALLAPSRVQTLTSIMSSSGARGLPQAAAHVGRALIARPASLAREAVIDHGVKLFKLIGSPGFPTDEPTLRQRIGAGIDRSFHPVGSQRQIMAIVADRRADLLHTIKSPTLVIHGQDDPLVPLANGEDTARRIPGAQMVRIPGMGHDLPPGVCEQVISHLLPFLGRHGAAQAA